MIKHSIEFDAYYDDITGEWLETNCGVKDCTFCKERPPKAPLKDIKLSYKEVYEALEQIMSIGKRNMSNPKYDGFFEEARAALEGNPTPL